MKIKMEIDVPVEMVKRLFNMTDYAINNERFAKAVQRQINEELLMKRFWEEAKNNGFTEEVYDV